MPKRQIPDTVTNEDVINYLCGLADHIEILENGHKVLIELAKLDHHEVI